MGKTKKRHVSLDIIQVIKAFSTNLVIMSFLYIYELLVMTACVLWNNMNHWKIPSKFDCIWIPFDLNFGHGQIWHMPEKIISFDRFEWIVGNNRCRVNMVSVRLPFCKMVTTLKLLYAAPFYFAECTLFVNLSYIWLIITFILIIHT